MTVITNEEFNKIIQTMDNLIENGLESAHTVLNERLYEKGTNFVNHMKSVLQGFQSKYDKSLTDFYHIIGMVDLSAADGSKILKRGKQLLNARATVKKAQSVLSAYETLISVSEKPGEYKLQVLGTTILEKVIK